MQSLRVICRFVCVLVGFGFLFGQIFNGFFGILYTIIGVFGMVVGIASSERRLHQITSQIIVLVCGGGALIGVAFNAIEYYAEFQYPGSYYSWTLIGPFIAAVLILMHQFRIRVSIGAVSGNDL